MKAAAILVSLGLLLWSGLALAAPSSPPKPPVPSAAPARPQASASPAPAANSQGIAFRELLRFADSQIRKPEQILLRNAQDFQAFWQRHAGPAPAPGVDFGKDWVIAVILGEQPTAGYSACVDSLKVEQDVLKVLLKSQFPPLDSFLPMQAFSPGCLVLLPQQATQRVDFSYLTQQQRTTLPMRTLSQISNSLILSPRLVLVQDDASFRELWGEHTGQLANLPAIDFSKEMVIAAFMGEQPSGGYSINIQEVAEADGRLHVKVTRTAPSPEQMVIQMLTAPAHLVAVPRRELPVEFD